MTENFQKIQLDYKDTSLTLSPKRKSSPVLKLIGIILLLIILLLGAVGVVAFFPLRDLYVSVQDTAAVAAGAYAGLKKQDIEETKTKLAEIDSHLQTVKANVDRLQWMSYIPFIGVYQKDAAHLVAASIAAVDAGKITADTLIPYSDLLGLKGKSTFVSGSADDRIHTAVETLDKILPNVDVIAQKLEIVDKEIEQVDFDKYPEKIGNTVIRSRFQTGKELFRQTASLFVDAQPLLKRIPDLLGIKDTRRYLILFQNDAEARATGGFLTGYGIFKIDKGKIQVEKSDDIYKLDASKNKKFPAPSPILKYHKNVNYFELRDSNLSPDFIVSMGQFESMLKDSVPGFPQYDGIIAMDTHVLVSTIKILGDFTILGRTFSAENDKRCDCPKVIYELEDYATKPVAYVREERKDIIGLLLYQIMQRALGVSPSQYWGKLAQTFFEEAQEKHILFYFHDETAQKGIDQLNLSGRILPAAGDYLLIDDVNFAGAKSNLFIHQTVKQDIKIEPDKSMTTTLTISYKNPQEASNCNLEAGQLCLNGILRNWLRIYVPKGSKLGEFKGSEKDTVTYDESDKTVFEGFLTVKPQGSAEVMVRYSVPAQYNTGSPYKLLIQKQPRTNDSEYTVILNGKKIEKFLLIKDKDMTIRR